MNERQNRDRRRQAKAGFTLIEILLVVVIIGMLATIVAVNVPKHLSGARINKARADIDSLSLSIESYNMNEGRYPASLDALTSGDEPYIPGGIPKDPWQNEYTYTFPGTHRPFKYDIVSRGPDGVESDDDIANWNKNQQKQD